MGAFSGFRSWGGAPRVNLKGHFSIPSPGERVSDIAVWVRYPSHG